LIAVVAVSESRDLPDQISIDPGTTVDNPFKARCRSSAAGVGGSFVLLKKFR